MLNTLGPKMAICILILLFLIFVTWNTTTSILWVFPPTVLFLWLLIILAFLVSAIYSTMVEKQK